MRLLFLISFFSLVYSPLLCQEKKDGSLVVKLVYGKDSFKIEDAKPISEHANETQFQVLKFYITGLEFYENGKRVWKENANYHLIDASKPESLKLPVYKPEHIRFDALKFVLGVDSLTNVSGVMGGDLDPTKGMYWTWQSGYIHFKLEGKSAACQNPKKEFQFHLGGYRAPYSTIQTITIVTAKLELVFDIKSFMEQLNLSKQDHLMLPGAEAKRLSDLLHRSFRK